MRRLGAAMLFSAALAASVAGAHAASLAEPLVTPAWLNSHRTEANLVVLDIRSAIDGNHLASPSSGRAVSPEDFAGAVAPCGAPCPSKK